jgi:hypothetical protein
MGQLANERAAGLRAAADRYRFGRPFLARWRPARVTEPAADLISGEAGIGKTRLVAELIATLDPALPVLAGQGSQEFVGAGVPLSCVVAILVK